MVDEPEFWKAVAEIATKSPAAFAAAFPGIIALWLALRAVKSREDGEPKHKAAATDGDKLDRILANIATLSEKVSHLEPISKRVDLLAEKIAYIEGTLRGGK